MMKVIEYRVSLESFMILFGNGTFIHLTMNQLSCWMSKDSLAPL